MRSGESCERVDCEDARSDAHVVDHHAGHLGLHVGSNTRASCEGALELAPGQEKERSERNPARHHSHSMVAGGFDEMS